MNYVASIKTRFRAHANASNAMGMKAYMKHHFEFLGIKSPERKVLSKEALNKINLPAMNECEAIVKKLWELPEREFQYFAMDLLEKRKRQMERHHIHLLEHLIVNKSWWDTVDLLASKLVGHYFQQFPSQIESITNRWMASGNMWLQRSCILFQLKYKADTNTKLLTRFILQCHTSSEFFLQKAIGWALREYAKTNPQYVINFVAKHALAPLSKREALKHIQS